MIDSSQPTQSRPELTGLLALYDRALVLTDSLLDRYDLTRECQSRLETLNELMSEASRRNQEWVGELPGRDSPGPGSAERRRQASVLAVKVRQLMDRFEQIEQRATSFRQNMLPQNSPRIQSARMQSAYAAGQLGQ